MSLYQLEELNDALMEAMVLLDPPHLNRPSKLTPVHVTKAHDMLISAANILGTEIFLQEEIPSVGGDHWSGHDNNIGDPRRDEMALELTLTTLVSDLFRALILSSTLLLEMCPWQEGQNENEAHDEKEVSHSDNDIYLSEQDVKNLFQTVRQSILLLRLLSHYVHWSTDKENSDRVCDWHDEMLPRSQHPLLQECFQRKELMDVEDNVVFSFGMGDRLISLNVQDYMYQYESHEGQYDTEMDMELEQNVNIQDGPCDSDYDHDRPSIFVNGYEGKIGDDDVIECNDEDAEEQAIPLSFDLKQLSTEEDILLDVAFPEQMKMKTNGKRNPHSLPAHTRQEQRQNKTGVMPSPLAGATRKKRKSLSIPSPSMQCRLEQDGIIQFIQLPFYQTCYVMKEGWLILRRVCDMQMQNIDEDVSNDLQKNTFTSDFDVSCYVYLFSNGFFCMYGSELKLGSASDKNDLLHAFSISGNSESKPTILGKIFHFTIDQLVERGKNTNVRSSLEGRCRNINGNFNGRPATDNVTATRTATTTVVLGVDEGKGGGLMTDGYNWMTAMNQCVKETIEFDQVGEALRREWSQ